MRCVYKGEVFVTPAMALDTLTRYRYERQRAAKVKTAIPRYARYMRNGQFWPSIITFHVVNGQKHLTDGQQRLNAVIVSGKPQTFIVVEWECDTMDEVHEAYARMDHGTIRTAPDVRKARQAGQQMGLKAWQQTALEKPVGIMMTSFAVDHIPPMDLAGDSLVLTDGALEWKDEATYLFEATKRIHKAIDKKMFRKPVWVAICLILLHQETDEDKPRVDDALRFIEGVARSKSDAGEAVQELSLALASPRFWGDKTIKEFSRTIARAWNGFRDGTKPRLYPTDREKAAPLHLDGTAYDGKNTVPYVPKGWADQKLAVDDDEESKTG